MFLLYGWSTIFWQAIALQYGKRPVYLASAAASIVVMAVAPMCTTSGTYLAIRILQVIVPPDKESFVTLTSPGIFWWTR
jgi:hypothetical protein